MVATASQALAFLTVFVYATPATQAIAFEWKPGFMCLLSDDARQSLFVLDTDIDNGEFTVSSLSAGTSYTLSVAAVSVAGESENAAVVNVTTESVTLPVEVIIVFAVVAPVFVVLALIGVCTCGRCVSCA